jgi:dUTP pyrophosphatase
MEHALPFVFVDEDARSGDEAARQLLTPRRATTSAAGLDLVAANRTPLTLERGAYGRIPTGIALAIPEGFEGQVRPRSGLAAKNGVTVLNAPGTIDADYRGEVQVILINHGPTPFVVERGMRVAQLVIAPVANFMCVSVGHLDETERGAGGFGSTGLPAKISGGQETL